MKIIKRVNPEIFPPTNPASGNKKLAGGGSQTARNISTSSKIQNQSLTNIKIEQPSSSYSAAATIPMDTTNNADEFDNEKLTRRYENFIFVSIYFKILDGPVKFRKERILLDKQRKMAN